jgi:hypothetical protein
VADQAGRLARAALDPDSRAGAVGGDVWRLAPSGG